MFIYIQCNILITIFGKFQSLEMIKWTVIVSVLCFLSLLYLLHDSHHGSGLSFRAPHIVYSHNKTTIINTGNYNSIETNKSPCDTSVTLQPFISGSDLSDQMFFIESSGRTKLSPRQACSVESAARFSRLQVQVILLADTLDLTDNSTCNLFTSQQINIGFWKADLTTFYEGTPLQDLVKSAIFLKSPHHVTHQSDAMRLALIFKYGGFYSDLDSVILGDLRQLRNVVGATKDSIRGNAHLGRSLQTFERNIYIF